MNPERPTPPEAHGELEVGKDMPGLKDAKELPEGQKYWHQVIQSPYGELIYSPNQFRDGKIRWITRDNKVEITVSAGGKTILNIDKGE